MTDGPNEEWGPEQEAAFHAQLVAIIPSLRSFARGLCGGRDMAEDLAQDTVMRAWSARKRFLVGSNFRAWMFTIMRNQFYTSIRKSGRSVVCDPEMAERVLVSEATQQAGLHVQDVAAALQKLPAEQREVLMLVGAQGVAYEEAANIIGCAVGTVKSRVARGRAALSKLLEGDEQDAGAVQVQQGGRPERLRVANC
jgi:RNA polymerase sigma-70 factor, ECF subfamily